MILFQSFSSPTYSTALAHYSGMLQPGQFWGTYTVWRAGSLHTASLSPSLALKSLRSSKGITCIGVLHMQDQLPSLWDDQLSNKLTISLPVHNWSCFSKAWGLKTSQTIIISHSSLFREQEGCFFSFLVLSVKTVCFYNTSCFPTRTGIRGEQKTWDRQRESKQWVLALQ